MRGVLGPAGCRRDFSLDSLGRGRWSCVGRAQRMAAQRPSLAHRGAAARALTDIIPRSRSARPRRYQGRGKPGCRVAPAEEGGLAMDIRLPTLVAAPDHVAALDRLGDEIAELSAHLHAATAPPLHSRA